MAAMALPIILGIIVFIVLCILVPVSVYAAQKWAYKSYKELVKIREILQSGERIPILDE